MKKYFLFASFCITFFCGIAYPSSPGLSTKPTISYRAEQDPSPQLETGYYLVIAAYGKSWEALAKNFADKVTKEGHPADYGFSQKKNMFFVYLLYTENFKESLNTLRETRKDTKFNDCWVYVSIATSEEGKTIIQKRVPEEEKEKEIEIEETIDKEQKEGTVETSPVSAPETPKKNENNPEAAPDTVSTTAKIERPSDEFIPEIPSHPEGMPISMTGKNVYMNVYDSRNDKLVNGEIQLIDTERLKLMGTHKNNTLTKIKDPQNRSGKMLLICDIFGYRKMQHEFNYYAQDTSEYFINALEDTLVVSFDLVRYVKGDLATMYNVYFYKDASVMMHSSEYELNSLLEMLHENKDYKIRIHGHTNGNAPGKIISPKESNTDFFNIKGDVKQGYGSAKQLSNERAEVIKDYLVHHGVDPERMEIKGWGGKKMIHDKHSNRAKKNVRVEVEILED